MSTTFFLPKGVQRYSWMDGLGKVKVRRCVGSQRDVGGSTAFGCFQPRHGKSKCKFRKKKHNEKHAGSRLVLVV